VVQVNEIDYTMFAKTMVRYFSRMESAQGEGWATGRRAAEAWQQLLTTSAWDQSALIELDELMLAGAHETGSAWIELTMLYDGWRGSATPPPAT
jgi:hypothetical protein